MGSGEMTDAYMKGRAQEGKCVASTYRMTELAECARQVAHGAENHRCHADTPADEKPLVQLPAHARLGVCTGGKKKGTIAAMAGVFMTRRDTTRT